MAVKQVKTPAGTVLGDSGGSFGLAGSHGGGGGGVSLVRKASNGGRARPAGPLRKKSVFSPIVAIQRELDLLQGLRHPHIVEYLGFEQNTEFTTMFLEYVAGGSIWSVLSKTGPFPDEVAWPLALQTLDGLDYLHSQGIIHRDIKAMNILMDILQGRLKISDFGVSKKLGGNAYRRTSDASTQGTARWMAPENVRSQGGYSAKIDIWSFGCVMIEMKSANMPWPALQAELQVYSQLIKNKAPPVPDDLSADMFAFVHRCFIIDPEERPTARDLLADPCLAGVERYGFPFQAFYKEAVEAWQLRKPAKRAESVDSDDDESDEDDDGEDGADDLNSGEEKDQVHSD
ncbi:kinase-like domain-containing protein [Entophlyctis helioformis]|nr:kinase-like domain-containing protein [Entophlyctis helioformis]